MPELLLQDEKQLLQNVAAGDEVAFVALYRQYSPRVYSFLLKAIPEPGVAEELVNDVFLQLWLTRDRLPEVRNLETYLFVLSRNRALNLAKKSLREKKNLKEWIANTGEPEDVRKIHSALDLIDEALTDLSEQQRRCWILSRRMGKTYYEIEQELNISSNTVKTHIQLANASIKKYVLKRLELPALIIMFLSKYF